MLRLAWRRRRLALTAVAVLAAAAGVGVALLVSADGGGLSERERAQLEAAGGRAGQRAPSPVERAARMPLPRQVAQLFAVGTGAKGPRDAFFSRLRARGWGTVVLRRENYVDADQVRALAARAGEVTRRARRVAALVGAEQPGGPGTAFPGMPPRAQPAIGTAGGPALARAQARASARNLRGLNLRLTLAPVADVAAAATPLELDAFGDDPRAVAALTRAAVGGYRAGGVISAVGHFPGQGSASEDPDEATGTVGLSLEELRARDLRPFAAAMAQRAPVIVTSNAVYAAFDGVTPAGLVPDVVGGLLRRQLGFRGVVMTDDLRGAAAVLGIGVGAAAVQALEAGADVLQVSGGPAEQDAALRSVVRAVRGGRISRERIRVSLLRVLALKRSQGLLPRAPGRAPRRARRR